MSNDHFGAEEGHGLHAHSHSAPLWLLLARFIVATVAISLVWYCGIPSPLWHALALTAIVFTGYPIFSEALRSLCRRQMTMELSMTIALAAALFIDEVLTSLLIVFFVMLAEELELLTVKRGRRSIGGLLDLLPKRSLIKRGKQFVECETSAISLGDIILVKPGSRIVVDGVVVEGHSFVDEATITGESFAVEKTIGSHVYAGTINQSGAIEVSASQIGADTAFGKIVNAVENAEHSQARVQRLANKMGGYLVLFALSAAALTYLFTWNLREAISVVIVAGACGIALGTPLAILGSIGQAAKRGSIVKGGLYIERLAGINTVVFDKTGTLTTGQQHVAAVHPFNGETAQTVLKIAASAETRSEHPLGRAVLLRAQELNLALDTPDSFAYLPGRGIKSDVGNRSVLVGNRALMDENNVGGLPAEATRPDDVSEMFVAVDAVLVGRIFITDTVRPEARQAIAELKTLGIRSVMLTGDGKSVARTVSAQLGIDEFHAEQRPEDKRLKVAQLKSSGYNVAMVGDGVNDAPALAEASVAVAIGSGTDVAIETANVVLIGGNLMRLVETVKIARRCQRVIWFNFVGTLVVDSLGMCLAMFGILSPLVAAMVHVGSDVAFMLNSARLFPVTHKDDDEK